MIYIKVAEIKARIEELKNSERDMTQDQELDSLLGLNLNALQAEEDQAGKVEAKKVSPRKSASKKDKR